MNNVKQVFERMVGIKRPYGGTGEGNALTHILKHLVPDGAFTWVDGAGNLHVDLRFQKEHRTLFVAHVDTMHHKDGPNPFTVDDKGVYHAPKGSALGADDGAGVALLSVLMDCVPAYYIFCRGEERGGIGSQYLANNHDDLLAEFDRAIAFDRRGYSDVITHQAHGRCASDAFGEALSDQLNNLGLLYMPSDRGIFTDTANFVDIIPECTNISVGYANEHGDKEVQDGEYLWSLAKAVVQVDWDSLPVVRDPKEIDEFSYMPSMFDRNVIPIGGKVTYEDDTDDTLFPATVTPREHDIAEAVYMALEHDPKPLMEMVAHFLGVKTSQIDETLFESAEVCAIAQDSDDWEDLIEIFADECSAYIQ